jgi:hypothetical protein
LIANVAKEVTSFPLTYIVGKELPPVLADNVGLE